MPVVVTGAAGGVGRVLVPLLAERGEVRTVIRSPSGGDALRAAGAKVAVAHLEDAFTLGAVMDGAHTVIHLAGGLDLPDDAAYEAANLDSVRLALEPAVEAKVARFLFLSYPGADPGSANVYLRAKGRAEAAVAESGLDHLILRCTHITGPGQRWLEEMREAARRPLAATVVGTGRQLVAPVHVEDVAAALAAADDRVEPVSGTLGIQGSDEVTVNELVDLLAGRRRRKLHLSPSAAARAARLFGRRVHPALLEILAADSVRDAPDAADALGVSPRGIRAELGEASGDSPSR